MGLPRGRLPRGDRSRGLIATETQDKDDSPPIAVDDVATTQSGQSVTVNVLSNDIDRDQNPLTVTGITQVEHGDIALNADHTLTYTAPVDFTE